MVDQDKLIVWLESVHKESNGEAFNAGNHMIEGMALGRVDLSYRLIQEIKKGTFMPEVKDIEYPPFDFDNRIIDTDFEYKTSREVYDI